MGNVMDLDFESPNNSSDSSGSNNNSSNNSGSNSNSNNSGSSNNSSDIEPSAPFYDEIFDTKPNADESNSYTNSDVSEEEEDCSICLEELEIYVLTECNHKFHYDCLSKMNSNICPLCRRNSDNIHRVRNKWQVELHSKYNSNIAASLSNTSNNDANNIITASSSNTNLVFLNGELIDYKEKYNRFYNPEQVLLSSLELFIHEFDRHNWRRNIPIDNIITQSLILLRNDINGFINVTAETSKYSRLAANIRIREVVINKDINACLLNNNEMDKMSHIRNIIKMVKNIEKIITKFCQN